MSAWNCRVLAVSLLVGALCVPDRARAEDTEHPGAGAVGGALLGAEIGVLTPALAGVKPTWAYVALAIVGATAGGLAGSHIEQRTVSEVPDALLGAGVVLLIPSVVWFGNLKDAREASASRAAHFNYSE